MAIDISSLQRYIALNPLLIQEKMYSELTLQKASIQDVSGVVPGKFSNRYITADAALGACCRVPTGSTTISERQAEVVCILSGDEYCELDLAQIISNAIAESQRARFTAGGENAGSVESVIVDANRTSFVNKLETLSWIGDVTHASNDLNRTNGLITIGESDGSIRYTITAGNAFLGLSQAIKQLPADARRMGEMIGVFVPEEFAEAYYEAAMYMNLYHYNPGDFVSGAERPVIGKAGYTLIPTPGLYGTRKIMITPLDNIVWFNSHRDDHNTIDWDYEKYRQLYYWRIKTIFGVDLKRPEYAVIASYEDSILEISESINVNITNTPLQTAITSPVGANGGVFTENTL